jgi:hypothetical protein
MIKETITYKDFDDVERTEDFYFNFTQAEVIQMEAGVHGGLTTLLEKIVASHDVKRIVEIFTEIILKAYGEKSDDGRRFIKSKELSDSFAQTEAFNVLYMKLLQDPDAAANFIRGIIPDKPIQGNKPAMHVPSNS